MRDTLLIVLNAFLGAVAAGGLGATALWPLRRRSLTVVAAAVAVTAMLAGMPSPGRCSSPRTT
jgi:hypothetical protein